ncbi:DUF3219 family protein [Lentibacillus sp. Marseille-P4043]|uniref:DUF3219 family protein n=1 Tax=Lentibacillus sp. Marseille-P4043 TaxID=2040293 RepID=UPI000D0AEB1D|nr:DUF3219 family protein [Lentibacillus sp. Marseille-P4043]
MNQKVIINNRTINVDNFYVDTVINKSRGKELLKVGFDFKVNSSDYHEITTLLYANDFHVKVPEKNLEFPATIYSYSTSITNLYEDGAVGDFALELKEKSELN